MANKRARNMIVKSSPPKKIRKRSPPRIDRPSWCICLRKNLGKRIEQTSVIATTMPRFRWKDWRHDISWAALLLQPTFNTSTRSFPGFEENKLMSVRYDHGTTFAFGKTDRKPVPVNSLHETSSVGIPSRSKAHRHFGDSSCQPGRTALM